MTPTTIDPNVCFVCGGTGDVVALDRREPSATEVVFRCACQHGTARGVKRAAVWCDVFGQRFRFVTADELRRGAIEEVRASLASILGATVAQDRRQASSGAEP